MEKLQLGKKVSDARSEAGQGLRQGQAAQAAPAVTVLRRRATPRQLKGGPSTQPGWSTTTISQPSVPKVLTFK